MTEDEINKLGDCVEFLKETCEIYVGQSGEATIEPPGVDPILISVSPRYWYDVDDGKKKTLVDLCALLLYKGDRCKSISFLSDWVRRYDDPFSGSRSESHQELGEVELTFAQKREQEISDIIEARRFSPDTEPPPAIPSHFIAGIPVSTPGNLVAIVGQPGSCKTTFACAGIASSTGAPGRDFLGWESENPAGYAVVHIDTEQSRQDHFAQMKRTLARGGIVRSDNIISVCVTGVNTHDVYSIFERLLADGSSRFGGVHSAWIDGVADMCLSPNDEHIANSLVTGLHALAIKYNCPIFCIIHQNPGKAKSRGHLGSQLERKCETELVLTKHVTRSKGMSLAFTSVATGKVRHAPIPPSIAPRFAWSDAHGMHISLAAQQEVKADLNQSALASLLSKVQGEGARPPLGYNAIRQLVMKVDACSRSTAKRRMDELIAAGLLTKSSHDDGYSWDQQKGTGSNGKNLH